MIHDVINPATEEPVTTVELFDLPATDDAIARSRKAFADWRRVSPGDRARLLRRFAEHHYVVHIGHLDSPRAEGGEDLRAMLSRVSDDLKQPVVPRQREVEPGNVERRVEERLVGAGHELEVALGQLGGAADEPG